jgi:hypothetical protein
MKFQTKIAARDYALRAMLSCYGLTMTVFVYNFIKWKKVIRFPDRLFDNLYDVTLSDLPFLMKNYFLVQGISVIYFIPFTIWIDYLLLTKVLRSK